MKMNPSSQIQFYRFRDGFLSTLYCQLHFLFKALAKVYQIKIQGIKYRASCIDNFTSSIQAAQNLWKEWRSVLATVLETLQY